MELKLNPMRIALIYASVGVAWILVSDWLVGDDFLFLFPPGPQTIKGLAYVILTAIMVYILIRVSGRRMEHERAWYRELFENNPQPMWVYDLGTLEFLAVNNAAVRHYGYSRREFLAMSIADIRPPEDVPALKVSVASVTEGLNRAGVWRHLRKDGSVIRVEISSHTVAFKGRRAEMVLAQDVTARLRAEEALLESEARFREMAENVQDIYYNYEPEYNRLLYVSPGAARVLGRPLEEIYANPMSYVDAVHPEDRAAVLEADRLQRLGETTDTEFRIRRPDGGISWIHDRSNSILDPGGNVLRVVGVMRDVTERKATELALRASEERLRLVTKATSDLIWDVDAVADTIWWGDSFGAFFGRPAPKGSVTTVNFWEDRVHPDDRERVLMHVDNAFKRGGTMWSNEYRLRREDGTYAHVLDRGYVVRDASGRAVRMIGGMADLTERRKAEAERDLLGAAIDQLGEMVVMTDASGIIQYVNPAFERTTGYSRAEAVGATPSLLKSGAHDEDFYRGLWETIRSGKSWTGRMINRRKDGALFTEESVISPVLGRDGKIRHFVAIKNDVSARLALEEQYRQAQKMEAIGRLAGGVAHDFNNMLTVILVRAEQAMRRLEVGSSLHDTLREIHGAAERSASLTRQLLTYARRQSVELRVINLNDTIGAMQGILRRLVREDIVLEWAPGPDLWAVRADASQVDQALANLCVNARDAIADVGRVVIETSNVVLDAEYCRIHSDARPGPHVRVSVSDDGAGMDAEVLSHIFEPFFTTKEVGRGTGLGLPMVYGIVRQAGGFVHVYSEPGTGTTVSLYFPRHADVPAVFADSAPVPLPVATGETVLVVEDEEMILEVAIEVLQGLGYDAIAAATPAEALEIEASRPGGVQLLLTDVIMPGMNGRELADRLRARRPGLKVLYMSGYTANVMASRGLVEGGGCAFIQKPFSTADLADKVRGVLDGPVG